MEKWKQELLEQAGNILKEEGCQIETRQVIKGTGPKEAFAIQFPGEAYQVLLYPEDFREMVLEGEGVEHAANVMASVAIESRINIPTLPETAEDYRNGLYCVLVNAEENRELLKEVPYMKVADDLALICRCKGGENEEGTLSFLVRNSHLYKFEMTGEEVLQKALENSAAKEYVLQSMTDCLKEVMFEDGLSQEETEAMLEGQETGLYVLRNKQEIQNGAVAIAVPEVMDRAYEELGGDFYILPSSRHEVLLYPEHLGDPETLQGIVRDANETVVKPEEKLSDHVYLYHGDTRKIQMYRGVKEELSQTRDKTKTESKGRGR